MAINCNTSFVKWLKTNILFIMLLLGVIFGFLAGFLVNETVQNSTDPSPKELAMFISFPGEMFLRMLQLLILPFVVSSVIISLATLDQKSATKLGKTAFLYFLLTNLIAVVLGVVIATLFLNPEVKELHGNDSQKGSSAIHAILDMFRNLVPDNIVEASFSSTVTKYKMTPTHYDFENRTTADLKSSVQNLSLFLKNEVINPWSISRDNVQVIREENIVSEYDGQMKYNSANILGVLAFSILCGVILHTLGDKGKPLVDLFDSLFVVILKMVDIFMWFSPIGIGCIIAGELAAMKDINGNIVALGIYILMVVIGSLVHCLIVLPLIYFTMLRKNPFLLLSHVTKALLAAFGTASSSATIPITMNCLEKNHKLDPRVTHFVLPIGTTLNKDGSGVYIAVAAIYIVKIYHGNTFDFGSAVLICFAATFAAIAAAPITGSIPIVTRTIVLQVIGIPSADIALILAVDWLIDRLTTPVNVWANCVACAVVQHVSRDELEPMNDECKTEDTCTTCDDLTGDVNSVAIDIVEEEERNIEKTKDIENIA